MATRLILALAAVAVASPISRLEPRNAAPVFTSCTKPGVVALTFDDGPYMYTDLVLDHLKAADMKATFFVNGQNFASIYEYPDTVRRIINEGHQIGSHTWDHPHMSEISAAEVVTQMTRLDDALVDIIGKSPTYMRPPFFDWSAETLDILGPMGYKVIHTDIDTKDYELNFDNSVAALVAGLNAGGSVILAHEVHQMTAELFVPAMISAIRVRGLKSVTMGECIGDAPENWYNTPELPEPTTTAEPEPTTTEEPEVPEPTTTDEPEVPEPTTTDEPEVPEPTTTDEPEVPEPTTTDEPEVPEETTPTEPEVPEETTTAYPEETTPTEPEVPEPTTTDEPEVPEETTPTYPEEPETTSTEPEQPDETTPTYPEEPETTSTEPEQPEETTPTYPEEPSATPTRTPGGSCRPKKRSIRK